MSEAPQSWLARSVLKAPIHVYRYTFKPFTGQSCRHWPTCSQYALEAIDRNGAWRGFWLMLSRLKRCGPGGTHGVDPVPDIRNEHHPLAPWRYGRWRTVNSDDRDDGRRHLEETTLKTILSPDRLRRVLIVQRPDGHFGFEEEHFSDASGKEYWLRASQYPLAVCHTPDAAEREARGRIDWMADVS